MKRLLFFFLLLLSLGSVSATFDAFGDTAINAEPCTTQARNLSIFNSGAEPATYTIATDGDGAAFALFSSTSFTLEPSQTGVITQFISIPCDARADTYTLDLFFSDETEEKVLPQTISVVYPDTINLTAQTTSQVIPPCATATYPVTIHNTANFTELYTITLEGHPDAHISHPALVLLARAQQTIEASVTPTDCTEHGSFPLTLTFESEKSAQAKQLNLELIITPTDIPELAPGISTIRTETGDNTAELTIKNLGDKTTTYALTLTSEPWASITPKTITLKPGQVLPVQLRLSPGAEVPEDRYEFTLAATVQETGIAYTKDITVNLKNPGFFEQNPLVGIAIILGILLVIALIIILVRYIRSEAFQEKYAAWKNRRAEKAAIRAQQREERKALRAERRAQRLLEREEAQAKREADKKKREAEKQRAQEQEERARQKLAEKKELAVKNLRAQVEKSLDKEYHLVDRKAVKAAKRSKQRSRPTMLIGGIILLALVVLGWSFIAPNLGAVILGLAILALILIVRRIVRAGVIRKRVKIAPKDAAFTLHAWTNGLRTLRVTAKNATKNLEIMVRRHRATIKPAPHTLTTFTLKTNAETSQIATFAVDKRLLKKHGAGLDELKCARYSVGVWKTIPLERAGEDKRYLFVSCPIQNGQHSLYLKLPKKAEKPAHKGRKLVIIGLVLLALAVLGSLSLRSTTPPGIIPAQVWKQDTVHTLNLAPFFSDPDGETLTFAATPTQKIAIDFIGSNAILTPANGFSGEERVRFIARDNSGASIESNTVSLVVVDTILPLQYRPVFSIIFGLIAIGALLLTLRGVLLANDRKKK